MTDGTDAFKDALDDLKRHADQQRLQPSDEASARMWARIDEATRESHPATSPSVRPPLRLADGAERPPQRWHDGTRAAADRGSAPGALRRVPMPVWMGIAATLIIGAVITLLVLQAPEAGLVASAGSERVEHVLPDGSIVTLRPHSELYLVASSSETVRYRLTGEAFFSVASLPERVFAVEAGEALVEVLGTRFNLSTWGESTSVYLDEGRIRFAYLPTGADVILEPGQSSRIAEASGPITPAAVATDEHLDWLDGEMVFEQRPVRLVADEIEHHFNIRLDVPPAAASETLSGRILLDSEEQSLDDLARAMGGRFIATGPNYYRFESDRIESD